MVDTTPRLALGELQAAQSQKHVTVNDALIQLDAFCDLYLLGQFVDTPPASPSDGDTYITGGAPSGAWSGYAYKIAYCIDGSWRFYTPFNGLRALVSGSDAISVYENGTWRALDPLAAGPSGTTLNATGLGIGATPTEALTVNGGIAASGGSTIGTTHSGATRNTLALLADSPRLLFGTSISHANWKICAQDEVSEALSIASGTDEADPSASIYTNLINIYSNGNFAPAVDNNQSCGISSARWSTIYAGTGTINTSAADTKTAIRALSDSEIAVAKTLAANVRVFQFCDAVTKKGADAARLHTGMIYEDVVAAFTAQSLDPLRYGIVCRDAMMKRVTGPAPSPADAANGVVPTVTEIPDTNEDGSPKYVMGLRYGELAQFVMAGMAARLAALEAK